MGSGAPGALATQDTGGVPAPTPRRIHPAAAIAACFVAVTLVPVAVVVVGRWGFSYTPAGDIGLLDLRVRDVWSSAIPLTGPYGTRGWDHPGPLLYYLLAIPSLLSGKAPWGTQVGGAVLQGLAVVWLARLAWRRGGLPMVAAAMAVTSLLWYAQDTTTLRDPWNPYIAVPFFTLFVFQTWLLATGDPRLLVGAVVVATLLVQSHIGYLPFVVVCAAVVVTCSLLDRRRHVAVMHGGWRRRLRWALVVGVVLWIPPLLDVVLHPPGNLWRIVRWFVRPPEGLERVGLGYAARLVGREFSLDTTWARGPESFLFTPEGRSAAWLVVPALLVGATVVVARRRHDTAGTRFVALAGVLVVTGIVALARVDGALVPYQYMWRPAIALMVPVGCAWVVLAGAAGRRPWLRIAGLAVAAVVVVAATHSLVDHLGVAVRKDSGSEHATTRIVDQLLRHGIPDGGVILRLDPGSPVQLQRGIYDELRRRGAPVFVDEQLAYQFGPGTGRAPSSVERVWWVTDIGGSLTQALAHPGGRLIASTSPLSRRDEARARELSDHLYQQFVAIGRPELAVLLDSDLLPAFTSKIDGIDHRAARELAALARRRIRSGAPRAGIVSFAPADAPADLTSG